MKFIQKICLILFVMGVCLIGVSGGDAINVFRGKVLNFNEMALSYFGDDQLVEGKITVVYDQVAEGTMPKKILGIKVGEIKINYYLIETVGIGTDGFPKLNSHFILFPTSDEKEKEEMDNLIYTFLECRKNKYYDLDEHALDIRGKVFKVRNDDLKNARNTTMTELFGYDEYDIRDYTLNCVIQSYNYDDAVRNFIVGIVLAVVSAGVFAFTFVKQRKDSIKKQLMMQ